MSTFPSTLPPGASELMRNDDVGGGLRRPQGHVQPQATTTRLTSLSPSLLQDLVRHDPDSRASDLLEVLAAALRHGRALLLHLGLGQQVIPLTLFPAERLAHCTLTPAQLLNSQLQDFKVLQVEPAQLQPPGSGECAALAFDGALYGPLGPLAWAIAMRGRRDTLLPELAGLAAYRVTAGIDLHALGMPHLLAEAVRRLCLEATNLREISAWPGLDRQRASRLLNALYMQSALIVSRAHPAATNEGWRSHPNVS